MAEKDLPTFDTFEEEERPPMTLVGGHLATETIDLGAVPEDDMTSSGSFDFRGVEATFFGKLLQALPVPSLLIDRSHEIIFTNRSCEKISSEYKRVEGRPFSSLFPNSHVAEEMRSLSERVFATRKPQVRAAVVQVEENRIWGRMHIRTLRMGGERALLVLVEDLTLEKKQLLLNQKHQRELRSEIAERSVAEEALRKNEAKFRTVAESAPFGLSIMAADRTFEYFNPRFTEILGYTLADLPDEETLFARTCPNEQHRQRVVSLWKKHTAVSADRRQVGPTVFEARCKERGTKIVSLRTMESGDGKFVLTFEDVTAETKAQNEIARAKMEWEKTFDAVPDLIMILDEEHKIVRLNRAMAVALGGNKEDWFGVRCFEVVHGTQAPPPFCPHLKLLADGEAHSEEVFDERLGGTFDVSVSPLRDTDGRLVGSVHVARDITERKRAQTALMESEERYRQLFEISPYPMLVHKQGTIFMANPAAARVHGMGSPEALTGKSLLALIDPEDACLVKQGIMEAEFEGRPAPFREIKLARPDGGDVFLESTVVPTVYGGEPAVLSVGQDITARKRAEESLLKAERLRAVGELASGVAHNFNNLLQVVMAGAQLAAINLEFGNSSDVKSHLDRILESSRLGAETVRRLQEFAQIRCDKTIGGGEGEEVFDLSHVVRKTIEMSQPWWKTKPEKEGITISLTAAFADGCSVKGREGEYVEVVLNLIKNAAEAVPAGGEIRITTAVENDKVVLRVSDDGVGMPEENLGKVFEPFWTDKGVQSTGMGLASSLGIVKRIGGEITIESEPGRGSTFTVTLPLAQEPANVLQQALTGELGLKMNILAIDDMEPVLLMLRDGLTEFGQTVWTALSGQQGIEIFKEQDIDLVICDLGMPGMTGWQVGRAIKEICEQKRVPKTPFILLTGWGGQFEEGAKISESGVDRIVEKPVDLPTLMKNIRIFSQGGQPRGVPATESPCT